MSIADLEKYAESTASTLMYLQMQCVRVVDLKSDHAASHVGTFSLTIGCMMFTMLRMLWVGGTITGSQRMLTYLDVCSCV